MLVWVGQKRETNALVLQKDLLQPEMNTLHPSPLSTLRTQEKTLICWRNPEEGHGSKAGECRDQR